MNVELLIVNGCPHADSARRLLRQVLDDLGLGHLAIDTTVIRSDDEARRRGFAGSPSFFANGDDLLADTAASPAYACRLYHTSTGPSPLPERSQLQQALTSMRERLPDRPESQGQPPINSLIDLSDEAAARLSGVRAHEHSAISRRSRFTTRPLRPAARQPHAASETPVDPHRSLPG